MWVLSQQLPRQSLQLVVGRTLAAWLPLGLLGAAAPLVVLIFLVLGKCSREPNKNDQEPGPRKFDYIFVSCSKELKLLDFFILRLG